MRQIALAVLLALPMPAAASSWLCVVEAATGFTLQGGQYVSAPYRAGRNFLIRPARREDVQVFYDKDLIKFVAEVLGERPPIAYFDTDIGDTTMERVSNYAGSVVFHFSPARQRFSVSTVYSYLADDNNAPFMEIGRCSKIY